MSRLGLALLLALATTPPAGTAQAQSARFAIDDRFSDPGFVNRNGWPTFRDAWFEPDGYHVFGRLESPQTDVGLFPIRAPQVNDVVVEAEMQLLSDIPVGEERGIGIHVRGRTGPTRGYRLFVERGFFTWHRLTDRSWSSLGGTRTVSTLALGRPRVLLKLVAKGNHLAAFVNGERVDWVEDDAWNESGTFGISVIRGMHVLITRFSARPATDDDLGPSAPIDFPYVERFRANRAAWPQDEPLDRQRSVERWRADGYHSRFGNPSDIVADRLPPVVDAVVEAELRLVETRPRDGDDPRTGYGVGMRAFVGNTIHRYALLLNERGEFSVQRHDGLDVRLLTPWQKHSAVQGAPSANTVRLAVEGARLTGHVNGIQVASVVDPDAASFPASRKVLLAGHGAYYFVAPRFAAWRPGPETPSDARAAPGRAVGEMATPRPAAPALAAADLLSAARWAPFTSPDGAAHVLLPAGVEPMSVVTQSPDDASGIYFALTLWDLQPHLGGSGVSYLFAYVEGDNLVTDEAYASILGPAQAGVARTNRDGLYSERSLMLDVHQGKEYLSFDVDAGLVSITRAYLVGKRVYVLAATAALDVPAGYDVDTFLDSLRIVAPAPR